MESHPPTVTEAHSGATIPPDPTGTSDVSRTPYDLDRAARAAEFEGDLEMGREVAVRLHAILRRRTSNGEPLDHAEMRAEWMATISDLWEGDPSGDALWLAAAANVYNALIRDLSAQVREAKDAR